MRIFVIEFDAWMEEVQLSNKTLKSLSNLAKISTNFPILRYYIYNVYNIYNKYIHLYTSNIYKIYVKGNQVVFHQHGVPFNLNIHLTVI